MTPYGTPEAPNYVHREFEMAEHSYATVCPHTVVVEIPDGFDPVTGMVDSLRSQKKQVLAEAQLKANKLEQQIQSLLAIEYKADKQ
jgi:hypothetical protein